MESIAFVILISLNDFLGNKIHLYQVVGQCLEAYQFASPAHPTIGVFLGSKQWSDVNAGIFHGIEVEIEIKEHLSHVPIGHECVLVNNSKQRIDCGQA
jgi:hypothetical protein